MEEVERERAAFAKERALAKSAKASHQVQGDFFGGMGASGIGGAETVEAAPVAVDGSAKVQPGEVLMDLLFKRGAEEPEPFEALGEDDIVGLPYSDIPSAEASPGKNFARSRAGRWVRSQGKHSLVFTWKLLLRVVGAEVCLCSLSCVVSARKVLIFERALQVVRDKRERCGASWRSSAGAVCRSVSVGNFRR